MTHEATPEESGQVGTLCLRNALAYAEGKEWDHAVALLDEARIWFMGAAPNSPAVRTAEPGTDYDHGYPLHQCCVPAPASAPSVTPDDDRP